MRRADRLFLIIHALRGRRTALQARSLAQTLGVSLRTVYRDVADLQLSGVPIEGEAGVGYVLRKGSDIPPLMFTANELEALVVGSRFVRAFAGTRLAESAQSALLKIEAVLPPELRERAARTRIFAPVWRDQYRDDFAALIDRLHAAIVDSQVLRLEYRDEGGKPSTREVEPLCLSFWGGKWTLGAWCRLRGDFRNFRPDRIDTCVPSGEVFVETGERDLAAYLRAVGVGKLDLG
ncbi:MULTISPECIES: helix-turn-helix transcriptional regulator [Rhodanobacter]|uniref:helix-turn-helix transcriptional regulator n=1 Tax=Rhodanobacter TaxID=75309 RepID=UPI000260E60E|nr:MULTISPECIES: YafY family protein [Rhodanobacter]EIM03155.1 Helix-turn-helix type 11 domain-containing protein [Rhodanobacter denitrificans]KZC20843.1 DNA-binding transcriptional regulator [Rhodanobacter denitrificans]UJJ51141.1 YafY family transcriptional regulator [Rhodanobacter denitrificans]UJJ60078.1 YafY family transcriptional regulator [Rhodanobacter denitrificans]UJM90354.1 YafY family transcriptional regulator [Rhodanobacter denitrificans]